MWFILVWLKEAFNARLKTVVLESVGVKYIRGIG